MFGTNRWLKSLNFLIITDSAGRQTCLDCETNDLDWRLGGAECQLASDSPQIPALLGRGRL